MEKGKWRDDTRKEGRGKEEKKAHNLNGTNKIHKKDPQKRPAKKTRKKDPQKRPPKKDPQNLKYHNKF